MIKNYVQKNSTVQAIQLTFHSLDECSKFVGTSGGINPGRGQFELDCMYGRRDISIGEFIVKFKDGEFIHFEEEEFFELYDVEQKVYEIPRASIIRLDGTDTKGPATVYIQDGRVVDVKFDEEVTEGVKIDQAASGSPVVIEPRDEFLKRMSICVGEFTGTPVQFVDVTPKSCLTDPKDAYPPDDFSNMCTSWDGFDPEEMDNQTEIKLEDKEALEQERKENAISLSNYIYTLKEDIEGVDKIKDLMSFLLTQINKK